MVSEPEKSLHYLTLLFWEGVEFCSLPSTLNLDLLWIFLPILESDRGFNFPVLVSLCDGESGHEERLAEATWRTPS